jgi:hypothetical protein
MTPKQNGVGRDGPTPVNQNTNCTLSSYHGATLTEAARALLTVTEAGLADDLRDELAAARWRWREDQNDQPIGMSPWLYFMAGDLATMTDLPRSACERAVRNAAVPDWPTIACAEIVAYAEKLKPARPKDEFPSSSAPSQPAAVPLSRPSASEVVRRAHKLRRAQ